MPIEVYDKGLREQLSEHFNLSEFDCKCTRPECDYTLVNSTLIKQLEALRAKVGHPVTITSGYRCEKYQEVLASAGFKTAKHSQHTEGNAADIKVQHFSGQELEVLAREAGFSSVGVARTWAHVDVRLGYRRWEY